MKNKLLCIAFILAPISGLFANPADEGKTIFMTRCAACHSVNKSLTGPALSGIDQRHSIEWIISFVKSSQTMIKNGDTAAVALYKKFNGVIMPDHADLSDADIKNIVDYIRSESKPLEENKGPFAKPTKKQTAYLPITTKDYGFFIGYFAAVIALVGCLFFAVQLTTFKKNKKGKTVSV